MIPEIIGKATEIRRVQETTSAEDRTLTISVPDQCFLNQTKARLQEICNRTVFKAHLPAQTHLNTQHHQPHQDHQHPDQALAPLQGFLHHLKTHLALPITDLLADHLSDHHRATVPNSADQEVPGQHSAHSSDLITSLAEVAHLFQWGLQDLLFMVKDIQWVDLDT